MLNNTDNKNNELDILAKIEIVQQDNDVLNFLDELNGDLKISNENDMINQYSLYTKIKNFLLFLIKYISTSAIIFILLMWLMNFSAYKSIALSYLDKETMEQNSLNLSKVIASNEKKEEIEIINEKEEVKEIDTSKLKEEIKDNKNTSTDIEENKTYHSMNKLLYKTNSENIDFDINIIPYENRVVIPKIGKNIPLLDVNKKTVKDAKELEDIFMKELEKWIIKYPGSANPWEKGNSFIFGHSSNLPWVDWEYNDVFALLDKVVYNDEIIVYYWQKQYKYIIREKRVISPGEVSVLERWEDKSEITLMTCRPIGTTLNRLIVVWELID